MNCIYFKPLRLFIITTVICPLFTWAADVPKEIKLQQEQTLNVGIGSEVPTLDPQKMQDISSARVANDLFEGLITEKDNGELTPGLAEKWKIDKNQTRYTFYLRPNIKFSDGSNITADDVVYSFRRLVDPKVASPYNDFIAMIKNSKEIIDGKAKLSELAVKAVNKNTIEIELVRPTPYFLKIIAFHSLYIVKKENVEKHGNQFTQPENLVSSGAYKLKQWKIGDKITAERNPYYWNNAKTVINKVNYRPISEANSEFQMYQTGQLDFTYDIPPEQFKKLKKTQPNEVHAHPYLSIYYFSFNHNKEPFKNNIKLRQAISMAIDRNIIAKKVTGRGEIAAYDLVPFGVTNYNQNSYEWVKWTRNKQIQMAQKLYKEAGYSKENPLSFTILYNTNEIHKKITTTIAAMLQETLGIKINLINQEWKVFLNERSQGHFQLARNGWIADYNDPITFLELFETNHPQNNGKYSNFKFDELISKSEDEANPETRKILFQNASKILLDDYACLPLFAYVTTHLVKSHIGGYTGENALNKQFSREFYKIAP